MEYALQYYFYPSINALVITWTVTHPGDIAEVQTVYENWRFQQGTVLPKMMSVKSISKQNSLKTCWYDLFRFFKKG